MAVLGAGAQLLILLIAWIQLLGLSKVKNDVRGLPTLGWNILGQSNVLLLWLPLLNM